VCQLHFNPMGLYHPLDGITNLKFKLLYFFTPIKKNSKRKARLALNQDRCCHLAICLQLIIFHCTKLSLSRTPQLALSIYLFSGEKCRRLFLPACRRCHRHLPDLHQLRGGQVVPVSRVQRRKKLQSRCQFNQLFA
jgi:hypothetical protein